MPEENEMEYVYAVKRCVPIGSDINLTLVPCVSVSMQRGDAFVKISDEEIFDGWS